MNINVKSSECAWHQSELTLLGRVIRGLRGFEYKKTVEKEPLYGSGQTALDITEGNIKVEGSIKVLGFERDALNRAARSAGYDDITSLPHESVVMTLKYKRSPTDPVTIDVVRGIAFTEVGSGMEQGAKMREVTLPFIAMDITGV